MTGGPFVSAGQKAEKPPMEKGQKGGTRAIRRTLEKRGGGALAPFYPRPSVS